MPQTLYWTEVETFWWCCKNFDSIILEKLHCGLGCGLEILFHCTLLCLFLSLLYVSECLHSSPWLLVPQDNKDSWYLIPDKFTNEGFAKWLSFDKQHYPLNHFKGKCALVAPFLGISD
jgi:hypothetical protein